MQNERPRKLQRISQACDLCHRRSIRCRPSNEDQERCQNCYDFDVACTYDRPSKRKKHPQAPSAPRDPNAPLATSLTSPLTQTSSSTTPYGLNDISSTAGASQTPKGGVSNHNDDSGDLSPANARVDLPNKSIDGKRPAFGALVALRPGEVEGFDLPWKAFILATEGIVFHLFDVYMQIIYPLFPLVDERTTRHRIQQRDYLNDRGFLATLMALCALTSARIRDGAYVGQIPDSLRKSEISSEIFFTAAKESLNRDYRLMNNFDYIRACTFLSVASIQYGHSTDVQQYLGKAWTLAAMQRFYDEKHWPTTLDDAEREIYRRVYWCTYTLDVYSAIVWNCFLRSQEIHASVRYPGDSQDEDRGTNISPSSGKPVSWLVGWNFALDLYRVLEHVINKARAKKFHHDDRRSVDNLVFADTFSDRNVMQTMLNMYYELPRQFKETPPMTGNLEEDRFGFQAANIQATLQLLRMMLFSLEDGPGVERKCDVANEVLQVFHTIPLPYLRAISTPLVYQLGSIGQILGSVLNEPLSEEVFERVRSALVLMADLLDNLESVLHRSAGAAHGLRAQVDKIDEYMQTRRERQIRSQARPRQQSMTNYSHVHLPSHPGPANAATAAGGVVLPNMSMPGPVSMSNAQLEMHADWPWQFFQEGNYHPHGSDPY